MAGKKQDQLQAEESPTSEDRPDMEAPEVKQAPAEAEPEPKPEVPDLIPEDAKQPGAETDADASKPEATAHDPYPDNPDENAQTPFDDDQTSRAIDEIVAKDGDDLLAVQDLAAGKAAAKVAAKHGGLWRHKWIRWAFVIVFLAGAGTVAGLPSSRYFVLNTAGVRSGSSATVMDSTTDLPLKGAEVSVAGVKIATDSQGKAKFTGLRLGPTTLRIKQTGFAEVVRPVVIGWGSNPFGNFELKPVGVQYVIEVRDYLSDRPVVGVEAVSGSASAVSDKSGKVTLTLANTVAAKDGATLTKAGYRTQPITFVEDPKQPTKVALVMSRKTVFVNKASGKYDVFKSDIDGQNKELLLAGTGNETSNISLVVSPDGNRAAMVSTRDNKRDTDGTLLNSLILIDIEKGNTTTIAQAPQIQLIDWIGARLIFQQVSSDSSASNRYSVVSYNYPDNARVQLAAANKLAAAFSAQGAIYYAVSADVDDASLQLGLFRIQPDGGGKQRVFSEEVWTVLRSDYNTLSLQQADETWHTYNIPNGATKVATPLSLAGLRFIDNPDRTKSAWLFQGGLLVHDVASSKDIKLPTGTSPVQPIQWLSANAIMYRISTSTETADYAVSIDGGTARKIADVSATYGF